MDENQGRAPGRRSDELAPHDPMEAQDKRNRRQSRILILAMAAVAGGLSLGLAVLRMMG